MIKCEKFLFIKIEGQANQSEGCDAKRCTSHLAGAALFLFVRVLFIEKLGVLMTDKGGFL